MVHSVQINKVTTLYVPTEEEWIQATVYYYYLNYIKRILSDTQEEQIEPKELKDNAYTNLF